MVKRIATTYSIKNDHVNKAVTFSTEEPLSSQSPASYSSNTPVGYAWIFGWFEKSLFDEIANKWENLFEHRSYLVGDKSSYTYETATYSGYEPAVYPGYEPIIYPGTV